MKIFFLGIIICFLQTACTNSEIKSYPKLNSDSSTLRILAAPAKSIKLIDSFIKVNEESIQKSTALREHFEGICTKQLLPLIDKKGLYDDIPFKLITTIVNNGIAYGNFIFEIDKHFIKVECIIKKKQLLDLQEGKQYFIKFKIEKFVSGVSFKNEFDKIEFPIIDAYLLSFKPCSN